MQRLFDNRSALELLCALDGIEDDRLLATIEREWRTIANEHKATVEIASGEIAPGIVAPGATVSHDAAWCFRDEQVRHRLGRGGRKTQKRGPAA